MPMYPEGKMHAQQSEEIELEWLVQPQLRLKLITPIRGLKIMHIWAKKNLSQDMDSGKGNLL